MNSTILLLIICCILCLISLFIKPTMKCSDKKIFINPNHKINKLMVVAHPDDESLFAGNLLLAKKGWLVVCLTGGSKRCQWGAKSRLRPYSFRPDRATEFKNAMNYVNASYILYDYEDGPFGYVFPGMEEELEEILTKYPIQEIYTFPKDGITGHRQHKNVHNLVDKVLDNIENKESFHNYFKLYHFNIGKIHTPIDRWEKKKELLDLYVSQRATIDKYRPMAKYESCDLVDRFLMY